MKRVYLDCNVVDVTDDCRVIAGRDIFVEDGRIAAIKPHGGDTSGWKSVDMSGKFALPGLINLHAHLFGTGMPSKVIGGGKAQERVLKFVYTPLGKFVLGRLVASAAKQELMSGVTTLRAVGDFRGSDLELAAKTRAGKGPVRGMKIFASGSALTAPGGHGAGTFALTADTPERFAKAAEEAIDAGADFVKICITGGVTDAKKRGEPGEVKMTAAQVEAVCNAAHARGKRVAAHVQSKAGMEIAALAGVDTVEHGAVMSEAAAQALRARGGAVITTFSPAIPYCKLPPSVTKLGEDCAYNSEIVLRGMNDAAHEAEEHGIAVGMGTDASCPFCTQYGMWREVVYFAKVGGFGAKKALRVATLGNAEILGIAGDTGSLEEGKSADIIFTREDPTADPAALSEVCRVVASGRDIAHPRVKHNKFVDKQLDMLLKEV